MQTLENLLEPTPLEVECRAEQLYSKWFDTHTVGWPRVSEEIKGILRGKAQEQLVREAQAAEGAALRDA